MMHHFPVIGNGKKPTGSPHLTGIVSLLELSEDLSQMVQAVADATLMELLLPEACRGPDLPGQRALPDCPLFRLPEQLFGHVRCSDSVGVEQEFQSEQPIKVSAAIETFARELEEQR